SASRVQSAKSKSCESLDINYSISCPLHHAISIRMLAEHNLPETARTRLIALRSERDDAHAIVRKATENVDKARLGLEHAERALRHFQEADRAGDLLKETFDSNGGKRIGRDTERLHAAEKEV